MTLIRLVKEQEQMSKRTDALAERLEEGARALGEFASQLTDAEWQMRLPNDGRKIGVIVHHVASVYPVEIMLALTIAEGNPITRMTSVTVDEMNAEHAKRNDTVTKEETLELLRRNSAAAATAIRNLDENDLDQAAPASLYSDAPVTCQFILEDHAVRHSYHHLARIRMAVQANVRAA